jgi:hypothetical protein
VTDRTPSPNFSFLGLAGSGTEVFLPCFIMSRLFLMSLVGLVEMGLTTLVVFSILFWIGLIPLLDSTTDPAKKPFCPNFIVLFLAVKFWPCMALALGPVLDSGLT